MLERDHVGSVLLVDATRKWPYPPLSLPREEFMRRALELWQELGLPELRLRSPWFGYSLGHWPEHEAVEAEVAVRGRYYETASGRRATVNPSKARACLASQGRASS